MIRREGLGPRPVEVHDVELLVATFLGDERDPRAGHPRLAGELEHDVVGELVDELAPVVERAPVVADQDRTPAGQVAHLSGELHLAPRDRPAAPHHSLGVGGILGRPAVRHREHTGLVEVVRQHLGRLDAGGLAGGRLRRSQGFAVDADPAALLADVDRHLVRPLAGRGGGREQRQNHERERAPHQGPAYSKPKWTPRSAPV